MPGVGKLLKQAQKMQKAMEAAQSELETLVIEGSAAGGAVKATVNGQSALKAIKIDPEFLKEDVASVEASIVAGGSRRNDKGKTDQRRKNVLYYRGIFFAVLRVEPAGLV